VAQTSQALSTDNTAVSNSILLELVALQRALANGTSLESIPSADTSFTAALSDVWVNGLWFMSLTLSLATALLAVLAKQWLRQYSSFITGSAHERAMIRQFRYACFDKWGVQLIIGLLPTILHLSLFLFMAGLVVFLYSLNHTTAAVVACIGGFLFGAYITTNVLPILAIGCPYRTPLSPLLYSFIYGPGHEFCVFCIRIVIFILAILHVLVHHALEFAGLLSKTRTKLPRVFFESHPRKSLRQAERSHVHRDEGQWTNSTLSWLVSTTSDPSAKIILIEALGTLKTPLNVELCHVFFQQWADISFLPNEPGTYSEEMLLGRLIRSTVTQSPQWHWVDMALMLKSLPQRPIWVNDHSTILAIASCCCTSTFHWIDNRPLVLPPHETFGFVIDHYAVFDQVIVPMWMWLSICVQAVGIEEISYDSHLLPEWFQTAQMLRNVATSDTYNMLAERNKITAWLNQHHISNDLQRAVDEKTGNPEPYLSRYAPVSLAMFLVVMREGRSLDDHEQWFELESLSSFATHHTAHSFQDLSTSSLQTEGLISHHPLSHSLRTIPEALAHPSSHPSQLPASVQNDSAEGDLSDAAAGASHLL
jgi:hypothetical protein